MDERLKKEIEEKTNKILEEVKLEKETVKKLVALFVSIIEGKYIMKTLPRGILFYGPPGTGKSLLMKTLKKVFPDLEIIMIRGPSIISMYYGKTEQKLREIFNEAMYKARERKLSLIFIDEIDSIAPRRDLVRGELEVRLVGQLLTLMQGLEKEEDKKEKGHVIVVASTNRINAIDPALRRPGRFDWEIEFPIPDEEKRREILEYFAEKQIKEEYRDKIDKNIKWDEIAKSTIGFTGADLLNLFYLTISKLLEGKIEKITQQVFEECIKEIKPSGLRELRIKKPEISESEKGKEIEEKVAEFIDGKKKFLLIKSKEIGIANEVAEYIAYRINEKSHKKDKKPIHFIITHGSLFKSRWFGETERELFMFFEKIKQTESVIYFKCIEAISITEEPHLTGVIGVMADALESLKQSKISFIASCQEGKEEKIDPYIREFFQEPYGIEISL